MKPLNSSSLNKALWIDIKAIAVSWIIVPLFQNIDTEPSHLKALPSRMPTAIQITRELVSASWVNAKQIAYKIYVHISFRPIFVSPTWSTFCRLCFSIKMSPSSDPSILQSGVRQMILLFNTTTMISAHYGNWRRFNAWLSFILDGSFTQL